jgi:nucleoside-diphosphate-sugar epimerase
LRSGAEEIIIASSLYASGLDETDIPETELPNPKYGHRNFYEKSKFKLEELAKDASQNGLAVKIIRPGMLLGPREIRIIYGYASLIARELEKAYGKIRLKESIEGRNPLDVSPRLTGYLDVTKDFSFVQDVATSIGFLSEEPIKPFEIQYFNLPNPNPTPITGKDIGIALDTTFNMHFVSAEGNVLNQNPTDLERSLANATSIFHPYTINPDRNAIWTNTRDALRGKYQRIPVTSELFVQEIVRHIRTQYGLETAI